MYDAPRESSAHAQNELDLRTAHIKDAGATLDVASRPSRRRHGPHGAARGAHPEVVGIETSLRYARLVLRAREETQPSPGSG